MLQLVEELRSVYKSVEDVEFLVGCLAESPRPSGYVISNTAFYVFIINASRRILCDRFYQVTQLIVVLQSGNCRWGPVLHVMAS